MNELAAAGLEVALALRGLSVRQHPAETRRQHIERLHGYVRASELALSVAKALLQYDKPAAGGGTARRPWSLLRDAARNLRTEADHANWSLRKLLAAQREEESAVIQCGNALKRLTTANQTVLDLLRDLEP